MADKIVIVDYGMGNPGSIKNMLKYLGFTSSISGKQSEIESADKLIISGVGAFDNGIEQFDELELKTLVEKKVYEEKTPILGICLGMQLFTKSSEEGSLPGFGWIDANVKRFCFKDSEQKGLKIPHMGWNRVRVAKPSPLTSKLTEDSRFYFVHSYHCVCNDKMDALLKTTYGYEFVSAFQKDNIFGVQFHPEKSHRFGMSLLKGFAEIGASEETNLNA